MAFKLSTARSADVASSSSRMQRPSVARHCNSRRATLLRAADNSAVPATQDRPVLVWPQDAETARDIFAFSGSLPERLNGRMAMLGFAGIALTELQQQVPAVEQLANDVSGVALLSAALTFASIFPKFVSGTSLKDLHASATSDNLKGASGLAQVLGLFDTSLELWTGRVAMIGVAGLMAVETFTGRVLF